MSNKINCQIMDINTRDIYIDAMGQRDVSRRKAQFNKIMRTFDKNLVQPISVAQIDGKFYCFDGQMTMQVLKAKNGDRDLPVKCRVYRGMTKMDAANMFIKQRGTASKVTLADKIRVMANYGDKKAIDFQNITEKNGLQISWTGTKSKNGITAVSAAWNEFLEFNDNDAYGSFIRVIRWAWNGDPTGAQSNILRGLGMFMRTYKGKFDEGHLINKLGKLNPNEILRNASVDRSSGPRKYAFQILQAYNSGLRQESRLPNIL